MAETNNEQHDFEENFKDQLGDFEVPRLNAEEEDQSMDQLFQNRLEELEKSPDDRVWATIKKELPLHLIWKKRLNHLSKVAAVLLFGLFLSILVSQQSSAILSLVGKSPVLIPTEAPAPIAEPSDFVFDGHSKKSDLDQKESSKTLFHEYSEEAQNKKDREFDTALLDPLKPLPSLPMQEVSIDLDNANSYTKTGTTASIPLRVVKKNTDDSEVMANGNHLVNPAQ